MNHHLTVSIADDGRGFDASGYYGSSTQPAGQGLDIMRERAESVDGKLRVTSMPGRGAEIHVEVPAKSRQAQLA